MTLIEELLRENSKFNSEDLHDHLGLGCIFLSDDKRKILLLDHVKFNFFTIPIGKVKYNETVVQGLKVEMSEELGVKLIKFHKVDVNTNNFDRNGKTIKVTQHVFLVDKYSGTPTNLEPEKHRSLEWYSLNKALSMNISDTTRRMIEGIQANIIE